MSITTRPTLTTPLRGLRRSIPATDKNGTSWAARAVLLWFLMLTGAVAYGNGLSPEPTVPAPTLLAPANPANAITPTPDRTAVPEWFNDAGRPVAQVADALAALLHADQQGLDPADYAASTLQQAFSTLPAQGPIPQQTAQTLGERLTRQLTHYLHDLRDGRIDPNRVHQKFDLPPKPPFDATAYIAGALQAGKLATALQQARPKVPMYDAVVNAMARYRKLEDDPAFMQNLPPLPGKKLTVGQPYAGLDLLRARLVGLGDLSSQTPLTAVYDDKLAEGIRSFQERHGLDADGVIGAATFKALQIPPARRVAQMALTLERLRWTPLQTHDRMIVVNIPEFSLRAYEVKDAGNIDLKLQMRVIVGRALDTSTPLFDEKMRYIEFSPYWNVPPSIARAETLPHIKRDPAWFNQQGFEFVLPDGSISTQVDTQNLTAVQSGRARIRQRPGPHNALGDIKFIFPNNTNIYLHHTPAPQLFSRSRRDFSHGCIRIEAPVELALFVLKNDPEWTRERIEEAMTAGTSKTIRLKEAIPVVLAYSTVIVQRNRVYFFDDIYGHDRQLAAALKALN